MAALPITCIMRARMPNAKGYTHAFKSDEAVRVVPSESEDAPDFIFNTKTTAGVIFSVAFIVTPNGTLAPEVAARAAKMNARFHTSYVVSLSGVLPAVRAPPRSVALSGNASDAVCFMLTTVRNLAGITRPVRPPEPVPPSADSLVDAVVAMPGVPSKGASTVLLCASGTLGDLACAPPQALAAVGGLTMAQAESLGAAFQQPSQMIMPGATSYKVA